MKSERERNNKKTTQELKKLTHDTKLATKMVSLNDGTMSKDNTHITKHKINYLDT